MSFRDRLTGGTNDVNPQYMTIKLPTLATTLVAVNESFPIPINRMISTRSAQVLEILRIEYYANGQGWGTGVDCGTKVSIGSAPFTRSTAAGATLSASGEQPTSPGLITQFFQTTDFGDATGVQMAKDWVIVRDLTDGAGHGVLVGSDNLYVNNVAAFGAATENKEGFLRILYRFKNVGMAEYVGIVAPSR